MLFSDCSETCGIVSSVVSAAAFGSYGVPMKCEASTRVDVDPLVFQSYKTFMVFATSWALVAVRAIDSPAFTPWGLVSAAFWVPAGTAGVYAVRRSGLAVSVGIWSSVIVGASFVWGVVIFRERVRSAAGAAGASVLLVCGICGISYFSGPPPGTGTGLRGGSDGGEVDGVVGGGGGGVGGGGGGGGERDADADSVAASASAAAGGGDDGGTGDIETPLLDDVGGGGVAGSDGYGSAGSESSSSVPAPAPAPLDAERHPRSGAPPASERSATFLRLRMTRYRLGLAMAALNGLLAATIMVPLHYAGPDTRGLPYSISFGVGAVIVTALLWALRFLYHLRRLGSVRGAMDSLPPFHLRAMWRPGCLSGLLFSIGNISGILSITSLGDFVGYGLGQSSLIVSGLWGILWYGEVRSARHAAGWFASAFVMLGGFLWLGYEHVQ